MCVVEFDCYQSGILFIFVTITATFGVKIIAGDINLKYITVTEDFLYVLAGHNLYYKNYAARREMKLKSLEQENKCLEESKRLAGEVKVETGPT